MQTCKHRIRAAQSQRSRLLRFLHSRQLSLRRRTTLYVACVRSSLLYGQHAVGITEPVLHLLAATDAKFVRALARSPAHITHESTDLLLRRLHLQSPLQALQALLDRRIHRSQDASAVARMTSTRQLLTNRIAEPSDAATGSLLRPVESCRCFGCSQCGQDFRTMRDLNTHLTKKHGPRKKPAKPRAGDLMQHAVDGMPQCRHCSAKFTRFEALQKHILGGCPSLFPDNAGCEQAAEEQTVEPLEAEGPSRVGEAKGSSPTVPCTTDEPSQMPAPVPPTSQHVALFDDPAFRGQLQTALWSVACSQRAQCQAAHAVVAP